MTRADRKHRQQIAAAGYPVWLYALRVAAVEIDGALWTTGGFTVPRKARRSALWRKARVSEVPSDFLPKLLNVIKRAEADLHDA